MGKGDTKERIARTAMRLFNESGTAAVSTNHIAEAMGISPGNLYYHYRNKEEIIRAVFERMNFSWEELFALPQDRTPTLGDLRRILGETFSVLWEYRFFYREFVALMRRDPELGRRYRGVRERGLANTEFILASFVEGGVLRGLEGPNAVPKLATTLWLITEFWLPFVEMGEETVGPERLQEGVDLMMQVLTPYMTKQTLAELDSDGQVVHMGGDET
jgi:AcrR family transcriptional regulator